LSVARDKIIRAGSLFEINRGERRGKDAMFYPKAGHGIESDYLRPVLKTPASVKGLLASADSEAFCCSKTLAELKRLDHTGALAWIKKFEGQVNGNGELLTVALKRTGKQWYEMSDSTLADLVASINYGDRLFFARMKERSFVNQRLTRFILSADGIHISMCHALLNSIASLWFLEALGFGRGLGVLDLNSTKLKDSLYMFDPNLLDARRAADVLGKFAPLLKRPVKPILEELQSSDRLAFEKAVLDAYGLASLLPQIVGSLKELYAIRVAAIR